STALARAEQLTLATLAQGAWFIVLGRFLGRTDLACGITMAHRPPTSSAPRTSSGR
ncbi:nonribosomal peptide synthetase CepB, partial [Streptomyces sp. Ncost-T6T-2b]